MLSEYAEDYDLFMRCVAGSEEAKAELFQQYSPLIIKRVKARIREADADDVIGDIYVKILTCIEKNQYRGDSTLNTYLHQVIAFTIADYYRRVYRREKYEWLLNDGPASLADTDNDNLTELLLSSIDVESQKRTIRLMLNGFTYAEVAEAESTSYEAVRSRYRRAVKCIQDTLGLSHISEVL